MKSMEDKKNGQNTKENTDYTKYETTRQLDKNERTTEIETGNFKRVAIDEGNNQHHYSCDHFYEWKSLLDFWRGLEEEL